MHNIMQLRADQTNLLNNESAPKLCHYQNEQSRSNGNESDVISDIESSLKIKQGAPSCDESKSRDNLNQSSTVTSEAHSSSEFQMKNKAAGCLNKLRQLVPILKVFVPLSMFWAIMYQRTTTFVLQAVQMNCYISSLHVPPGE